MPKSHPKPLDPKPPNPKPLNPKLMPKGHPVLEEEDASFVCIDRGFVEHAFRQIPRNEGFVRMTWVLYRDYIRAIYKDDRRAI